MTSGAAKEDARSANMLMTDVYMMGATGERWLRRLKMKKWARVRVELELRVSSC